MYCLVGWLADELMHIIILAQQYHLCDARHFLSPPFGLDSSFSNKKGCSPADAVDAIGLGRTRALYVSDPQLALIVLTPGPNVRCGGCKAVVLSTSQHFDFPGGGERAHECGLMRVFASRDSKLAVLSRTPGVDLDACSGRPRLQRTIPQSNGSS